VAVGISLCIAAGPVRRGAADAGPLAGPEGLLPGDPITMLPEYVRLIGGLIVLPFHLHESQDELCGIHPPTSRKNSGCQGRGLSVGRRARSDDVDEIGASLSYH